MVSFITGMALSSYGDEMDECYFIQLLCSFFMCGLIWVIQMVHYPAFNFVNEDHFTSFENFHTTRITLIVVPVMLIELVSACILALIDMNVVSLTNLFLLVLIWLVTFTCSVPCHTGLRKSKSTKLIKKLIATNWLRTFLWTTKSVLLVF